MLTGIFLAFLRSYHLPETNLTAFSEGTISKGFAQCNRLWFKDDTNYNVLLFLCGLGGFAWCQWQAGRKII
jgi:hypothetical protein